jgi:hypothetical protein
MERNADDLLGGTSQGGAGSTGSSGLSGGSLGNSGSLSGTSGYGSVGGAADSGLSGSLGASTGASSGASSEGVADRAKDLAGNAQEKLADVSSSVRDRAGDAKNSLADMLATGAERLRSRTGVSGTAELSGVGGATASTDGRLSQVGERVAGGMESTADWLRDADIDSLRTGVEKQVKEHPGRTLLIAAGLGYLLGKAFRR